MNILLGCFGAGLFGFLLAVGGINIGVLVYWPLIIMYVIAQFFAIEALFGGER